MNSASRININASVRESSFAVSQFTNSNVPYQQFDSSGNFIHYSQDYSGGSIEVILNAAAGGASGQRFILSPGDSYVGNYTSFSLGSAGPCAAGILHYGQNFSLSRLDVLNRRFPPMNSLNALETNNGFYNINFSRLTPRTVNSGALYAGGLLLQGGFSGFLSTIDSLITPSVDGLIPTLRRKIKAVVIRNASLSVSGLANFTEANGPYAPFCPPKIICRAFQNPDGDTSSISQGFLAGAFELESQDITVLPQVGGVNKVLMTGIYKCKNEIVLIPRDNINLITSYGLTSGSFVFFSPNNVASPAFIVQNITTIMGGDLINIL